MQEYILTSWCWVWWWRGSPVDPPQRQLVFLKRWDVHHIYSEWRVRQSAQPQQCCSPPRWASSYPLGISLHTHTQSYSWLQHLTSSILLPLHSKIRFEVSNLMKSVVLTEGKMNKKRKSKTRYFRPFYFRISNKVLQSTTQSPAVKQISANIKLRVHSWA